MFTFCKYILYLALLTKAVMPEKYPIVAISEAFDAESASLCKAGDLPIVLSGSAEGHSGHSKENQLLGDCCYSKCHSLKRAYLQQGLGSQGQIACAWEETVRLVILHRICCTDRFMKGGYKQNQTLPNTKAASFANLR